MATADELLAAAVEAEADKTLVIDNDLRTITIPPSVKNLGVESDDGVLWLHFRMPSMYGDIDLSTFKIRINYMNAKGEGDVAVAKNVAASDGFITFSWKIERHAAAYKGNVHFIVCLKNMDLSSVITEEFNTTVATLPVLEGLETTEKVVQQNPDILENILARLDSLETNGTSTGGSCNIPRIETAVNDKPKINLRDLDSGTYIIYGYFEPYPNSNISMSADNSMVSVIKKDAGTHAICLDPLNAKIVFFEILVDDTTEKGYTYTRTIIPLLDVYNVLGNGGGACNVPRYESAEETEAGIRNLRELDSGTYILDGYWNAYPGADTYMPFDNRLVTVEKQTAGSHLFVYETLNAKVIFHEILVDAAAADGFTHTRTEIDLLDMHNTAQNAQEIDVSVFEDLSGLSGVTITVTRKNDPNKQSASVYDGKTPVKGVDYFTPAEIQDIAEQAAEMVEVPDSSQTGAVLYTAQNLTDAQKVQARENIEACEVPSEEVNRTYTLDDCPTTGQISTAGQYQDTLAFKCTDFIQVGPNFTIEYSGVSYTSNLAIAFYDAEKVFVSGIQTTTGATDWSFKGAVNVPKNVVYVRFTFLNNSTAQYYKISGELKVDTAVILARVSALESRNPLPGKVLTATGDSINVAVSNRQYAGFAKIIAEDNGMTYETKAIWGATIADGISGSSGCILTTLDNMRQDADYVILSGGANDFYYLSSGAEALGEISVGYTADLDTTTFCGALESMCKTAISRWPGKKILYVITHRMLDIGHADLENWIARMITILEKWGVPYVDLWHDMPSLMLPALKNLYTTNGNTVYEGTGDGLHPNEDGYRLYYVPRVETKLKAI